MARARAATSKSRSRSKSSPRRASAAITAARKLRDPRARAELLEACLATVDRPDRLIAALGNALFAFGGNDEIAARLPAIAMKASRDVRLLEAIGEELDRRWCESEAIAVLQLALAAGSSNQETLVTLGQALAVRGDPACVALLERALELDPDDDTPRTALALYFLERDPPRALSLLQLVEGGEAEDLRAMLHAAAGREDAARVALAAALASYDSRREGHLELCEWHASGNRFPRAVFHARALLEMRTAGKRMPAAERARVDEAIVHAFHFGHVFGEIVPWVVSLCERRVPPAIAWDVFHGLTSLTPTPHPELAIRAAETCAAEDPEDANTWRVEIASVRSSELDTSPLAALAADGLGNDAEAWVALANAYRAFDAPDAASAAVDRALELDPSSVGALTAMYDLAMDAGDLALMERAANAVAVADPHGHEGCERLGRLRSRRGEGAAAIELAVQAVRMAPFCHNAWLGLGEARLVLGELDGAREAAARSAAILAPEPGSETAVLLAALGGDPSVLEAELVEAHRHLPAPPFPEFLAALRAACRT